MYLIYYLDSVRFIKYKACESGSFLWSIIYPPFGIYNIVIVEVYRTHSDHHYGKAPKGLLSDYPVAYEPECEQPSLTYLMY